MLDMLKMFNLTRSEEVIILTLAPTVIILFILILVRLIVRTLKNPYKFPYYYVDLDVSRRKNVKMIDELEMYLIQNGLDEFTMHCNHIEEWKTQTYQLANKSILKSRRQKQFNQIIDDKSAFIFRLRRKQTRYFQKNYVKTPYVVMNVVEEFRCDYDYLVNRYEELEKIDFETTTSKYREKNQRRMMTSELRERIKLRDNYTCQICGKYMPDGVGLHIDHIIPVSKGGKSIESNLQVLCSVYNGSKSNKI